MHGFKGAMKTFVPYLVIVIAFAFFLEPTPVSHNHNNCKKNVVVKNFHISYSFQITTFTFKPSNPNLPFLISTFRICNNVLMHLTFNLLLFCFLFYYLIMYISYFTSSPFPPPIWLLRYSYCKKFFLCEISLH
ncbi:uncharacterized protein RJT21DRAFT_120876 [Scheffersomyces amazonensis]|uniref:uncharacterized protein n=1 Tax=Scheffersomyces amazonensis TaxID=1078765 RepID=UPI00315C7323